MVFEIARAYSRDWRRLKLFTNFAMESQNPTDMMIPKHRNYFSTCLRSFPWCGMFGYELCTSCTTNWNTYHPWLIRAAYYAQDGLRTACTGLNAEPRSCECGPYHGVRVLMEMSVVLYPNSLPVRSLRFLLRTAVFLVTMTGSARKKICGHGNAAVVSMSTSWGLSEEVLLRYMQESCWKCCRLGDEKHASSR